MTILNQSDRPDTDRYHVPNLERALSVLEYLAKEDHPRGITEIAEALDFPKNSVFRIVSTLHAYGYLNRDEASKQYRLGTKLLTLGYAAVREGQLVDKSLDVMRLVRDETGETVMVGMLDGHEGIVLEHMPSNQQVQVVVSVGSRFPLHTAAPGKAMLAYLSDAERDAILKKMTFTKYTENTITNSKAMMTAIEFTREKGYATDNGEHNEGIRCVGAAILNQRNYPVGSIWVTGPSFRLKEENFDRVGAVLQEGALRISRRFGYDG